MKDSMHYIVDHRGVKTSVIVPFDEWEKINSDYKKLQNKLEVLLAVRDGLGEIKAAKKKYEEFQTLSDFLNEKLSTMPLVSLFKSERKTWNHTNTPTN